MVLGLGNSNAVRVSIRMRTDLARTRLRNLNSQFLVTNDMSVELCLGLGGVFGIGEIAYIALWIIIPKAPS